MKQFSKKLTFVLMALVFAVVAVFGVASVCLNAGGDSVVANAESSSVSEKWFEINYTSTEIEILLNGSFRDYLSANRGDIDALVSALASAAREIVAKGILDNETVASAGDIPFDPSEFDPADFDWNSTSLLSKFKDYVVERLSDPNEFEKFVEGEYDVLIDYAIGDYISSQKGNEQEAYEKINSAMKDVVNQAYDNAKENAKNELGEYFDESEWEAKKEQAENKSEERVESVKENGGKATVSIKQVIRAFQSVSVNGNLLYSAKSGLSFDGLRSVLALIPRPSQIADMNASELRKLVSAHLDVDTTFGTISFDLSFGFFGDTSLITSAMRKIAEHIDLNFDGPNVDLTINVPQAVTSAYTKFLTSSRFTDEQKNLVFSVFSKSQEEIFDYCADYSYQDVLDLLKSVDYKNWLANLVNANYINHYFGSYITPVLGHPLTNENIDKLINKVHDFFASKNWDYITVASVEGWLKQNVPGMDRITVPAKLEAVAQKLLNVAKRIDWDKYDADYVREICASSDYKVNETIYSYIDKLGTYENYYNKVVSYAEKLFGYLPEKVQNASIVDLYDGEKFVGNIDRLINISSITSRIANFLSARGYDSIAKYVENIPALLDRDTYHLNLSVEVNVPNLYKVEYKAGESVVREGFLPSGLSYDVIATLARLNNIEGYEILYWADASNYEQISEMPASNLTLVGVTEFQVESSENVDVVYALETSHEISVAVKGISNATYSYAWYKDGVELENNSLSLSVSDVCDSGEYYVVVTDNATGVTVNSEPITVNISACEIVLDLSQIELKENSYVYSGDKVRIDLVDNAILNSGFVPAVMDFKVVGDAVTQINVGEYSLTYSFYLTDEDNFTLSGETEKTLVWNIAKAVVNVNSSALELVENSYVYNGSPITVALVEGALDASGYLQDTLNLVWDETVLTQTNSGDYSTTLSVTLKDDKNYELVENEVVVLSSSKTLAWSIAKQTVELNNVQVGEKSFVYNGLVHEVSLVDGCYDAELLNVTKEGTDSAVNAGEYNVSYTFALVDDANYTLEGETVWSYDWSIAQIHVSLDNVAIRENEFVYSGTQRKVSLVSRCYNVALFNLDVSGTTYATNVGNYQVTYSFSLKDEVNYVIDGDSEFVFDWSINPILVSAPEAWNDTYSFVYGQRVRVSYKGIPQSDRNAYTRVSYEYKKGDDIVDINANDFAWNVGEYSVTARFELVSENYAVEGSSARTWELTKNISITPKHLDLSGATWVAEENATYYFNKEYTVRLSLDGTTNLTASEKRLVKSMLVYRVNGNIENEPLVFVNAGTYTISASFSDPNYTATAISPLEYTIAKRNVKVEVKWGEVVEFVENDGTISYYPINVLVYAEGYKNNPLPVSVAKVEYSGCEASAVGEYTAKVNVTLLDTDNFVLVGESEFTNGWKINKKPDVPPEPPVKDPFEAGHKFEGNDGISVEIVSGTVPADYKVSTSDATLELKDIEDQLKDLFGDKKFEIANAYDIHFENEAGTEKGVNGKFKVTLPIPEEYLNAKELAVIHIDDEGNITVVRGAERVGNEMQFETDGFSIFAVISLDVEIPWVLIICLIVVAVILIICIILTIILIRKKKASDKLESEYDSSEEVAETTEDVKDEVEETVENAVEEPVSEEPETVENEEPVEDVQEESVEPTEEAPVVEETVEENNESEEAVVEEPVSEEPIEETPVTEEVVEETVAPIAEENEDTLNREEISEEPTPVVEMPIEPLVTEDVLPIVDLTVEEVIVLERSFSARLSQANELLQARYSDLKNYALSYRNVKARTSWACDSINRGRKKVCKLVIKGKTLFVYLAINCDELPVKYHAKPVNGKKYEATPTMLKLRSGRAVKYAKEIIDMIMSGYEVSKKKVYTPVDFKAEYKTDEELIEAGLIKKKVTTKKSTPWNK